MSEAYAAIITQLHLTMAKFEDSSPSVLLLDEIRQQVNVIEASVFQTGALTEGERLERMEVAAREVLLYLECLSHEVDVIVTSGMLKVVRENVDRVRSVVAECRHVPAYGSLATVS